MYYEMSYGYDAERCAMRVASDASSTVFCAQSDAQDAACWVSYRMHASIDDTYIMIPACAYDGNRFEGVRRRYPPMFNEDEFGLDVPVRMTQVPRLSRDGDSFMDVTTGDMAAPCVCVLNKAAGESFMLFFNPQVMGRNLGVTLEQRGDELEIRLRAPAKRRLVYRWYDGYPSLKPLPEADPALAVRAGDELEIAHDVFVDECRDIPELYRLFFERRAVRFHAQAHACLPFSEYFSELERELNEHRYMEQYGLLALGAREDDSRFNQWQAGWVGGGMSTYPLICEGEPRSVERALSTLRFATRYQSKAGFYYGIVFNGQVYGDCFGYYEEKHNALLIRKHADLTYFMFKQLVALGRRGIAAPDVAQGAERAADALAALWHRYSQLGQFVNSETGEILVGGSTSGGIAPAALCAAAQVLDRPELAQTARDIARYYYREAILRGVTTGGPGEILQAPDSESIAGLLESYITLYDLDGSDEWLSMARDAAHQMASWVVPYDYPFPPDSRFGRMGIRAAGSVWANVQNKHSAPGLCTLSPAAFFKLYRATGEPAYLELMRQIAHFMPQVASRPDRPMCTVDGRQMRPGEICERVNMSDWEGVNNVGDSIFGSSSWPEVSLLLTCLEIPGVYAVPERGVVCASDHVNAWLDGDALSIATPTMYDANVKVMIEDPDALRRPLGLYWQQRFQRVSVPAGGCVRVGLRSTPEA